MENGPSPPAASQCASFTVKGQDIHTHQKPHHELDHEPRSRSTEGSLKCFLLSHCMLANMLSLWLQPTQLKAKKD